MMMFVTVYNIKGKGTGLHQESQEKREEHYERP